MILHLLILFNEVIINSNKVLQREVQCQFVDNTPELGLRISVSLSLSRNTDRLSISNAEQHNKQIHNGVYDVTQCQSHRTLRIPNHVPCNRTYIAAHGITYTACCVTDVM